MKVEKTKIENMRKDKNFKSRPGVYNIQQKDSIKKKKQTQKNGRNKNQRNNSLTIPHLQGHISID